MRKWHFYLALSLVSISGALIRSGPGFAFRGLASLRCPAGLGGPCPSQAEKGVSPIDPAKLAELADAMSSARKGGAISLAELSGHYAFNWLDPSSAHCARVDASRKTIDCVLKKPQESFDGRSGSYYACKSGGHSELLVFATREICLRELTANSKNERGK